MKGSLRVLVALGFLMTAPSDAPAQQPGHVMAAPADLKWADAPPILQPGAKIAIMEGPLTNPGPFTFRLMLPANYKVAPHFHPAIEHVTVLSGTFRVGMGEKFAPEQLKPLPAGSFAVMPPQTPHFVWVQEETVIQVHGVGPWGLTYVNPEDDPRKK